MLCLEGGVFVFVFDAVQMSVQNMMLLWLDAVVGLDERGVE